MVCPVEQFGGHVCLLHNHQHLTQIKCVSIQLVQPLIIHGSETSLVSESLSPDCCLPTRLKTNNYSIPCQPLKHPKSQSRSVQFSLVWFCHALSNYQSSNSAVHPVCIVKVSDTRDPWFSVDTTESGPFSAQVNTVSLQHTTRGAAGNFGLYGRKKIGLSKP